MYLQGLLEHTQQQADGSDLRYANLLRLADGRHLAWAEFGASQGYPLFYCHNYASTRLEAQFFHDSARAAGFRLISVDRPGLGLSDFSVNHDQTHFVEDVRQLADHLGLTDFGVLSWGGGGGFAFALSAAMPERVRFQLSLACVPFAALGDGGGHTWKQLLMLMVLRSLIRARCHVSARLHGPAQYLQRLSEQLCSADRKVLEHPEVQSLLLQDIRESTRQGYRGVAQDAALGFQARHFDPAAVKVPVHLWQGDADTLVPANYGESLSRALPRARLHSARRRGHFFFLPDAAEPIFSAGRTYL